MYRGSRAEYSPAQEAWLHSISTPWISTSTPEEREDFSLEAFAKNVTPTVDLLELPRACACLVPSPQQRNSHSATHGHKEHLGKGLQDAN